MERNIILIGFMGSGKTAVGRQLAKELDIPLMDTDEEIERQAGISISQIFSRFGEGAFRDMETNLLKELQKQQLGSGERMVISVGGGMSEREENRALMKQLGDVVYLQAEIGTLVMRLAGDTTRPKLQGQDLETVIKNLMARRESCYLDASDIQVRTDGDDPQGIAKRIIKMLK